MMMDGKKHEVIRTTLAPPIRPMNADDIADAAADAAHPEWRAADFCQRQNGNFKRDRWLSYIAGDCGPNGGTPDLAKEFTFGKLMGAFQCHASDGMFLSDVAISEAYAKRFVRMTHDGFREFREGYTSGFWAAYYSRPNRRTT